MEKGIRYGHVGVLFIKCRCLALSASSECVLLLETTPRGAYARSSAARRGFSPVYCAGGPAADPPPAGGVRWGSTRTPRLSPRQESCLRAGERVLERTVGGLSRRSGSLKWEAMQRSACVTDLSVCLLTGYTPTGI